MTIERVKRNEKPTEIPTSKIAELQGIGIYVEKTARELKANDKKFADKGFYGCNVGCNKSAVWFTAVYCYDKGITEQHLAKEIVDVQNLARPILFPEHYRREGKSRKGKIAF